MAGSIKWFVYTNDGGEEFAVKLDESNTEAVNGDTQDYTPTTGITIGVPRNIKLREVFYSDDQRKRTIRCVPLTLDAYSGILNGNIPSIPDPITPGFTLFLIRANGERRVFPFGADTGLDDGDVT